MAFDTWSGHALVVDADGERRAALHRTLEDYGWRVSEAADAEACANVLEDTRPDVVLADVAAPDALLERIRDIDEDVPLVVLGGPPTSLQVLEALRDGAFDRVGRPDPDPDPLYAALERAAAHARKIVATRAETERQDTRTRKLEEAQRTLTAKVAGLEADLAAALTRAEQADKAKSAFLANMSHELRTPLNAILGYAELLGEDLADIGAEHVRHDLERIRGAGTHLLSLISDVLELARIEAGRSEVYFEAVDIGAVLERVVEDLAVGAAAKGNTMIIEGCPEGAVVTDVAKLGAILDRIVGNANKFTSRGEIRLSADVAGGVLSVRVADEGIGITPEQKRLIFREFSQGDTSTTRRYGGTGLGLTIASRLVDLLGGSIAVDSEAGAQGSVFVVQLPIPADRTAPAMATTPTVEEPAADPVTLLLIDADATLRRQMTTHLTRAGYRVLATASGVEGLRLARARQPDVILLDVVLPDVDGWNLLMGFKRDPRVRDIPVVLVTLADDRTRGLAVGAADYLVKPIRRDALLATMRRVMPPSASGPILVVEDDEATRDVTQRMLAAEGWHVEAVSNGRLALEWLEDNPLPALILLDLMMPEVDGFHVITELQCRDDWKEIPVVVFTAMDVPPARQAFLESHVEMVLRKGGYGQDRMLDEVRKLVDRSLG
ncbi:MAG: response regulator [Alphaproteobacteria bacterium]|nr:response regulator [Alphaproteobacteria bacterium]